MSKLQRDIFLAKIDGLNINAHFQSLYLANVIKTKYPLTKHIYTHHQVVWYQLELKSIEYMYNG
jgi:hypothetical protein